MEKKAEQRFTQRRAEQQIDTQRVDHFCGTKRILWLKHSDANILAAVLRQNAKHMAGTCIRIHRHLKPGQPQGPGAARAAQQLPGLLRDKLLVKTPSCNEGHLLHE
eukprot:1147675-Pelagomonas_calceolata.AAC.6